MPEPLDARAVTATVVGLARTLRAAGVDAGTDRVIEAARALAALDATRRQDVYWAGRVTLCASPDDVARYDAVFEAYFSGQPVVGVQRREPPPLLLPVAVVTPGEGQGEDEHDMRAVAAASRTETLRERDVARMTPAERAELASLLAAFRLPGELRRSRRRVPARRGRVDRARTVRALLGSGGEPARLRFTGRRERPRRVVLLVDVSGSMSAYADALLRFAHAASVRPVSGAAPGQRAGGPPVEVFTVGTRLTRVTEEMRHRDPDRALADVAAAVPDWSGGTRLGDLLKAFLDRWGQRGMARGAIVVILSDGWERGDVHLLAGQMGRLHRLAHRVVWANPRKGQDGYQPLAAGMAAALPHVDQFVSGHSLEALERLASVVRDAAAVTKRA
jgi:hypothetical protein